MLREAAVVALLVLVAGCGSDSESAPPKTPAAEPGKAPVVTDALPGRVVRVGDAPEGIVIGTSGIAAVGVRNPDGVALVDAATGAVRQTVRTQGAPRHLALAGPDGPLLVPLEGSNELLDVDLATGKVIATVGGVGHQPHDVAQTSDGTRVVTNELGGGMVFVRNNAVASSVPPGPPQPGGVAAVGPYAAVADVQGNGVFVYDGAAGKEVAHAPVGKKLTHIVTMVDRTVAVADTDGGAVFVESVTPDVRQVARIDAPGNPYGLAYNARRGLLLVTLTATNMLRVIDVSNPSVPKILGDLPTVRQPNSVAVEPNTGNVLVTGSDPGGDSSLQIIDVNELPSR
ncbi:hypothetical protein [Antrihabitans cavernicola]|uniref:YncE family protein n=1 Tax=Antrihabitans cavernicola TaxID=2495913 RepID=A0A5A7SG63_9NOCA|nr:hypothetical protein [Spelaeibacter cavernicola]KAA0024182.1 hypothetical protein FOY51_06465 [Spelaeibacter cavernicola]